ncbi:MAG TPA: hypothetical protein VFB69_01300 [Candidatus Dormibacteraeota bacterium]|nr:hypothetical protein [Candidatus Dormibacteraeota bacterium]
MSAMVLERELDRLEALWDEGLADCYHSYLDASDDVDVDLRQRLALAAALVEVGIRLQGLGGPAAPAPALLMGDLCLARSSRILTDSASRAVQVAFARAVERLASAAASNLEAPNARELLTRALAAR